MHMARCVSVFQWQDLSSPFVTEVTQCRCDLARSVVVKCFFVLAVTGKFPITTNLEKHCETDAGMSHTGRVHTCATLTVICVLTTGSPRTSSRRKQLSYFVDQNLGRKVHGNSRSFRLLNGSDVSLIHYLLLQVVAVRTFSYIPPGVRLSTLLETISSSQELVQINRCHSSQFLTVFFFFCTAESLQNQFVVSTQLIARRVFGLAILHAAFGFWLLCSFSPRASIELACCIDVALCPVGLELAILYAAFGFGLIFSSLALEQSGYLLKRSIAACTYSFFREVNSPAPSSSATHTRGAKAFTNCKSVFWISSEFFSNLRL